MLPGSSCSCLAAVCLFAAPDAVLGSSDGSAGGRKLVYPFEASLYLGRVSEELGGGVDLYALTPYSRYHMR